MRQHFFDTMKFHKGSSNAQGLQPMLRLTTSAETTRVKTQTDLEAERENEDITIHFQNF